MGKLERLDGMGPGLATTAPWNRAATLADDGYVYLAGMIERSLVASLRDRVLEICERLGWLGPNSRCSSGDALFVQFVREATALPEFDAVRGNARVVEIVEQLLGEPVTAGWADMCRVAFPNFPEGRTLPHQDSHYLRGVSTRFWNLWVPLGDCPLEDGPLALLAGSHRNGTLPHRDLGSGKGEVVMADGCWHTGEMSAGDALLFDGRMVHCACENTGTQLRLSMDCRYRSL